MSESTNFASALTSAQDPSKINEVRIDGVVVLKIIKHTRESSPDLVCGQLLGLDRGATLEITNCFGFPRSDDEDGDDTQYPVEMMRCMREVNMDASTVGLYQSTFLGAFTVDQVNNMYNYQSRFGDRFICLSYDPLRSVQGTLALKAVRLSSKFMQLRNDNQFTGETLQKLDLTAADMFDELPLSIHNPTLIHAYLFSLKESFSSASTSFERFDLSTNSYMERNMEILLDSSEEFCSDLNRYQSYLRAVAKSQQQKQMFGKRRKEGQGADDDEQQNFKDPHEPSRLEAMLTGQQMSTYCSQVQQFADQSLQKMFMLDGLNSAKK